nr:hypothetical protein GCM10025732_07280 [Glycomyces mayteni]
MGERLLAVLGDDDALAGGEAVVLDDVGRAELVERGLGLLAGAAGARGGGRDARGGHDLLREGLRALDAGGLAVRAVHGDALRADRVGDARDERGLRAHDHEVGGGGHRQGRHRGGVGLVHRHALAERGHAGVPGGADELGDGSVRGQGRREGVLAAAGADQEYSHPASLRGGYVLVNRHAEWPALRTRPPIGRHGRRRGPILSDPAGKMAPIFPGVGGG